jgi:eukaryotic-like serine/threonine-protein kinase
MIGIVLRDRYKILEQFGSGGFSDVYLAQDIDTPSRRCIVKRLKPKISDSKELEAFLPKAREMFEKEAEQLQKLGDSSSQIPTLYAYFQEGVDFYLVMEYIEGHDLRQEIVEGVNMAEKTALQLLKDVLEALKTVHEKGIVHRDVKPDNIRRRDSDNKIVLIDFGAIKEVASPRISQNKRYASKTISIGTEGYMPPEQATGRPRLSSDIYALGTMIIEALTGTFPDKIPRDSRDQFEWRSHTSHVTPAFADYVDKMVRQEFSQRFEDATVALTELGKLSLNTHTVRVSKSGRHETTLEHESRSNSKLWIGVAGLGLIIIGGFALSNGIFRPIPPTPDPIPTPTPDPTPTPTPDPTPTPTPDPTPTPTPDPTDQKLNDLLRPLNCSRASTAEHINGKFSIKWTYAGSVHEGGLAMNGETGLMRIQYFSSRTQTAESVDQDILLANCTQGLRLLGYNPRLAGTDTPLTTYSADNINIRQNTDGSFDLANCDDLGQCARVEIQKIE